MCVTHEHPDPARSGRIFDKHCFVKHSKQGPSLQFYLKRHFVMFALKIREGVKAWGSEYHTSATVLECKAPKRDALAGRVGSSSGKDLIRLFARQK